MQNNFGFIEKRKGLSLPAGVWPWKFFLLFLQKKALWPSSVDRFVRSSDSKTDGNERLYIHMKYIDSEAQIVTLNKRTVNVHLVLLGMKIWPSRQGDNLSKTGNI